MYREFGRMLCEALDRPYLQAPIGLHSTTNFLRKLGELLGLDPEPFIEREKHTTIKPLWDLWRSVTQDFFGTASFAIVANETYARGVRHFLEDEMGLPCTFAFVAQGRASSPTTTRCARRCARSRRWSCSAATTSACTLAEAGGRAHLHPGVVSRARSSAAHTGTPFMGYAGATYLVQEVCNALFDALFHILPLGTDLDRVEATPSRLHDELPWDERRARPRSTRLVEAQPVLVRISAAKRLRDAAERDARAAGEAARHRARVVRATLRGDAA